MVLLANWLTELTSFDPSGPVHVAPPTKPSDMIFW